MTIPQSGPGDPVATPSAAQVETAPTGAALSSSTRGQAAVPRVEGTTQSARRDGKPPFIHGLRGIASMAVALFRCYDSTRVAAQVAATMSVAIDRVIVRVASRNFVTGCLT